MNTILITGANGFIGTHVMRSIYPDHKLYALARTWVNKPGLIDGIDYIEGNIADETLFKSLPSRIDMVLHLAAYNDVAGAEQNPIDPFRINSLATLQLAEYARNAGAQMFIYVSTGSVYRPHNQPLDENAPVAPATVYAFTKYLGEQIVERYRQYFTISILRLFHPYGPGQQQAKLIPRLIHRIKNGLPVTINRDYSPRLSFIYHADLNQIISRVISNRIPGLFNIAHDAASVYEVCQRIGEQLNIKPVYEFSDKTASNILSDNRNMISAIGHLPATALPAGLDHCLAYFNR